MLGIVPSGMTFIRSFVKSGKTWLKSGNGAAETDTRTFKYSHVNTRTLIPTVSFRIFMYRATQTHLGASVHTHTHTHTNTQTHTQHNTQHSHHPQHTRNTHNTHTHTHTQIYATHTNTQHTQTYTTQTHTHKTHTYTTQTHTTHAQHTHTHTQTHSHKLSQDGDIRRLLPLKKGSLLNCCSLYRKAPCWEQPSSWKTKRNYIIRHSSFILVAIIQWRRIVEARRRDQMIHPSVM